MDIQEQITKIEKEIRETPYHKATEHHIGRLRAKLAKLKDKVIEERSRRPREPQARRGYVVKKQGDATVTLVGEPSVGKSTLLNKLTNAKSKIAPYAFTTVSVIPGMMEYKDAKIQILDVPGLIKGSEIGRGRGKEVISVARGSDLLIILCDVENVDSLRKISESLERSGIRINKTPPDVVISKKLRGGITIHSNINQDISKETIVQIAKEFRIVNAEITIKEKLSLDRLIDAFSPNRVYIPAIYVINKLDLINNKRFNNSNHSTNQAFYISAEKGTNIDKLKEVIWEKLEFIRVYLVKHGEKPSKQNPLVMKRGQTLIDVARKIGDEFAEGKTKVKIWGKGAKYESQEVSLSKKVREGMQVRFV